MKKQILTVISRRLVPAAFLLVLPFVLGPTMHQALGQRSANLSQVAPPSTGAITGTYAVPARPAPNIPTLSGDAGTCTPGPWTQAAPVAVDHYGGFMDSNGTFAYEGGGYSFSMSGNINQFGRFDPVANTWTPLAAVPDLNNGKASGVYAPNVNKLFVFGGENVGTATVVNTTRIYDIASNTWSTGANMPDVRAFMASGYYNGKIYLVGGYSTGNITPAFLQTWQYDPVANSFVTKSSIPAATGFGGAGSGVVNGHLYVAGGRDANNNVIATTWDYNIATDTWTQRANVTTAVNVPGSAVVGGKVWIFGGGNAFVGSEALPKSKGVLAPDTTNILQIYDPATDTWTSGPTLNQQRSFPAGTQVGNTAIAVGGYTGSTTTTSVEINTCGGGGGGCQFRVLIAYADGGGPPTTIQNEILAEQGVTAVDLFDAQSNTPTLAQLQQYNIVFAFSNNAWHDAVAMGNVLADYEDGGGVVVVGTFAFDSRGGWLLQGRWVTGGYTPFNSSSQTNFSSNTANIIQHCLTQGVNSLTAFYRNGVTLTSGAVAVANWTDGPPAVAYKANNGHTAVGINAYLGQNPQNFSGDWGHLIVNAGRCLLNCGCSGTKIYNIAGFGASGQTTTTRIYDVTANSWTTGAPIPEANGLADHATAYWSGKIYVAGGFNGSGATSTLHIYDIAGNSWTTGAAMPQALYLAGFGAINGKVYVASGNNGSSELNTLYIYDIASNTWTTGANVPTPVTGPGSAVYQGKLYLFGGGFPTTRTITQIYDPGTNSWSSGPNMNVNRLWFYGGAIGNTSIVAPGGDQNPGVPIDDNEQLTSSWAIKAPVPYNARGPFAVSDGTVVYIGGGYDGTTVHVDTLRYDPVANTYTTLAPAPDPHYLSQAVIVTCAPQVTGAVSRKTHGGAGTFDINMPLTGSSGVECRSGGGTHDYSLVVTFSGNVTVTGMPQAQVISGVGCVGTGGTCDPNGTVSVSGNVVTVPLTNIADVQVINVQINGVNGASDEPAVNVNIPMGILVGDVNGNRTVNSSDVALTKSQVGQPVGAGNFREDVNASGTITATDVSIVKSDVGHSVP